MKLRFWRKQPTTPENCNHSGAKVRRLNTLSHVPLKGGHHTSFMILKCERCGGMMGFPSENLGLALRDGVPEVKDRLRVLGERILSLP